MLNWFFFQFFFQNLFANPYFALFSGWCQSPSQEKKRIHRQWLFRAPEKAPQAGTILYLSSLFSSYPPAMNIGYRISKIRLIWIDGFAVFSSVDAISDRGNTEPKGTDCCRSCIYRAHSTVQRQLVVGRLLYKSPRHSHLISYPNLVILMLLFAFYSDTYLF